MFKKLLIVGATTVTLCSVSFLSSTALAQLQTAKNVSSQTLTSAAKSQQKIDNLSEETARLVSDYRANLKQLEQSQKYNRSLSRQVSLQENQMTRIRTDIESLSGLQKSMLPLMENMLTRLEELVDADLPFNKEERRARVARLKRLVDDPSQSEAQKYRLIVEAYQIELEYGKTIGAATGTVEDEDKVYEGVDLYRVGRMLLVYKTSDDKRLRVWDKDSKAWADLNRKFLPDVKLGLRMARELSPPDLLFVPVAKANDSSSN